jgi:hypothetical protein
VCYSNYQYFFFFWGVDERKWKRMGQRLLQSRSDFLANQGLLTQDINSLLNSIKEISA